MLYYSVVQYIMLYIYIYIYMCEMQVLTVFKKGGTHMGIVREVNTEIDTQPRFEVVYISM